MQNILTLDEVNAILQSVSGPDWGLLDRLPKDVSSLEMGAEKVGGIALAVSNANETWLARVDEPSSQEWLKSFCKLLPSSNTHILEQGVADSLRRSLGEHKPNWVCNTSVLQGGCLECPILLCTLSSYDDRPLQEGIQELGKWGGLVWPHAQLIRTTLNDRDREKGNWVKILTALGQKMDLAAELGGKSAPPEKERTRL